MNCEFLHYPLGEQDFKSIREEGKVYVDKTSLVYSLVNRYKFVFLSRPRRFGKSLLLSTIQAYFEGEKQLFRDLAISQLEKEWTRHPVIHLELSRHNPSDPGSLEAIVEEQFQIWEKIYGVSEIQKTLSARFARIIRNAFETTGEKAVVLIDEYDHPLIGTLSSSKQHTENRELLKSVYSNLKALDQYIRFAMLTGVTRFSKTSIFSGINNLTDITFFNEYADICGFTENELRTFLHSGIEKLGKENAWTFDEAVAQLKKFYDGYHFSKKCPDIYNPYSLIRALDRSEISDYWFESGRPSFLISKLKDTNEPFSRIFQDSADESTLTESDTAFSSPVSLLFQTGYLTIKGYDADNQEYLLGIPNTEVEKALFKGLLARFTGLEKKEATAEALRLVEFLKKGEPEKFIENLRIFLHSVPYEAIPRPSERYFQNLLYLMFRFSNLKVEAEKRTSYGRSDLIVETEGYLYVFELKLDRSAEEAMKQIEEKGYAIPFSHDGRKIIKVGLNFSSATRNLQDWIILKTYSK